MSGVHDMGGEPAGPLKLEEHTPSEFDQRVDAMLRLLAHPARGYFTVDAMRRSIESLPPADYHGLAYYERWLHAVATLAVERGLVDARELEARVATLAGADQVPEPCERPATGRLDAAGGEAGLRTVEGTDTERPGR